MGLNILPSASTAWGVAGGDDIFLTWKSDDDDREKNLQYLIEHGTQLLNLSLRLILLLDILQYSSFSVFVFYMLLTMTSVV